MRTGTIIGHLFSLVALVLFSCECLSTDESISPIVDTELPTTATQGTTVSFKVYHVMFNGCGEYARQQTTRNGRTITIKFYGEYPNCGMCPTNIPTIETTYRFKANEKGDYYFKFYENNFNGNEFILDTLKVQ